MALLFLCGVLGMWTFTMDTLAMTLGAVALSTLGLVGLVLHLSALLRAEEFALLRSMGASPRLVPALFLVEAALLLTLASALAASLVGAGAMVLQYALGG